MIKINKNLIFLAVFLIAVPGFSGISSAQEGLGLKIDAACFPEEGDTLETLLEVYYTLPRSQLRFIPAGETFEAAMDITLRLNNAAGDSVDQIAWRGKTTIDNLKELENKEYKFFDTVPAFVRPGEYYITVGIKDVNSGLNARVKKKIYVPDYNRPGLKISQIQLAYSINPDSTGNPAAKDGNLIIPNASGVVTPEDNFIFFYAELHGFKFDAESPGNFQISVSTLDASDKLFYEFYSKTYKKPGTSAIIANGVNAYVLPDGNYRLKIAATDLETGITVETYKPFTIKHLLSAKIHPLMLSLYKAHPEANTIQDEDNAKLVRNQIEYIANGEELRTYEKLSIDGKNRFMKDFWEKRDPDLSNNLNEFQVQHYARWDYANESFASRSYQKGWTTDRGRIFIVYGPPAESENRGVQIDTRAHEIWRYYNIPGYGEGIFVFVDEQGHGDYRLYHSNIRGEKFVREWLEKLQASKTIR